MIFGISLRAHEVWRGHNANDTECRAGCTTVTDRLRCKRVTDRMTEHLATF